MPYDMNDVADCYTNRQEPEKVIDDGGPAFPHSIKQNVFTEGMSVRMWLAGQIAGGLLVRMNPKMTPSDLAHQSFVAADALIAESKKGKSG